MVIAWGGCMNWLLLLLLPLPSDIVICGGRGVMP